MTGEEPRDSRITTFVTADVKKRFKAYARRYRWSESQAAAVLIEAGLIEQEEAEVQEQLLREIDDDLGRL